MPIQWVIGEICNRKTKLKNKDWNEKGGKPHDQSKNHAKMLFLFKNLLGWFSS